MDSSSIKIRMRKCPKSIARTEIDLGIIFVIVEDLSSAVAGLREEVDLQTEPLVTLCHFVCY